MRSGSTPAVSGRRASRRRGLLWPLLLALLVACGEDERVSPADSDEVRALLDEPAALARGEALYAGSCAAFCHGDSEDPILNLFDCEWQHGSSDGEIFEVVTTGIPDTRMVGFGDNWPEGEADLWRIIAFLRHNQAPCG